MIQLQVYIDEDLNELIKREAKKLRQSRSTYARSLLVQALERVGVIRHPVAEAKDEKVKYEHA